MLCLCPFFFFLSGFKFQGGFIFFLFKAFIHAYGCNNKNDVDLLWSHTYCLPRVVVWL